MFSIGDIRDVSFGNSNKSYILNLPLTKTNKRLLKFISQIDVKSEPSATGRLYIGELLIISGTVLITGYSDYYTKIVINSDDWIDALKDKKMVSLDLSASDHTLTHANVEDSWVTETPQTSFPFYRYPMIDFGALVSAEYGATAKWRPNDFIPMLSVSQMIIMILSPYTISSTFLGTTFAKNLFILGKEVIVDPSFISNKGLEVNVTAAGDNDTTSNIPVGESLDVILSKVLEFKTETKDEANAFSIDTTYTIPATGTYRFTGTIVLRNTAFGNTHLTITDESVTLWMLKNGATTVDTIQTAAYVATELIHAKTFSLDSEYYHFTIGDTVTLSISCHCNATNIGPDIEPVSVGLTIDSKLELVWDSICKYSGLQKSISLEEMLPDMSQVDFLAVIRDVFNLRFWFDKMRRTIYIEPWDQFLSDTVVDLTEFIDFENIDTELIAPNYSKTVRLKWKEDSSDMAFTEYLKLNTIGPDSKDIALTSLFAKNGEESREHPFSSIITGINYTTFDQTTPVPRIWNSLPAYPFNMFDRKTGFNTRLVEWKGLTAGFTWYYETEEKTNYPKIAGLNFATMYTDYWQKFYHYIDKGKILTVKMKIKPTFLTQFFTVIANSSNEGFRPTYCVEIKDSKNYFFLQKIVSDGISAELELVLKT
jgi:hypothetical protein